jgi:hypothetical protein
MTSHMTAAIHRTLPLILALALVGCSQFSVRSSRDPSADFTGLGTYAWLPLDQADAADQRVLDRYIDARIRRAVDRELGAKGFRPAAAGKPDFYLNYRLSTEPADAVKGGRRPYYGPGWGAWPGAETLLRESHDSGTLFLLALEPASKRAMWIGAAQARLLPHISLEKRAKRADDVVHAILADFPRR